MTSTYFKRSISISHTDRARSCQARTMPYSTDRRTAMAHTRVSLPNQSGYALLSDDALTDTAIIYVHGFWGGPEVTWENILYYVDRLSEDPFGRSDLFFFDYPAERDFLIVSASMLRRFLKTIYPIPPDQLFSISMQDIDWRYRGAEDVQLRIREVKPYTRT